MKKLLLSMFSLFVTIIAINAQTSYTGYFRTAIGNTNYHQFSRNNAGGSAVYINQVSTGPILRLSSGTEDPNSGVKFTFEGNGSLGIGTTTPTKKLEISLQAHGDGVKITNSVSNGGSYLSFIDSDGKQANIASFTSNFTDANYRNALQFFARNGKNIQFSTSTSSVAGTNKLVILNNGNVGIGTITPSEKLSITDGQIYLGTSTTNQVETGRIRFSEYNGTSYQGAFMHYDGSTNLFHLGVHEQNDQNAASDINAITIKRSNGNIGVGTTSPAAKLDVNGNIRAEKIDVIVDVPASDYVFEEDYNLRSLEEVETFVKENKHLPEVPSAAEFKENGYSVGEMDDLLLRKVEELTLYIIEQQKLIKQLQEKVENLENQ